MGFTPPSGRTIPVPLQPPKNLCVILYQKSSVRSLKDLKGKQSGIGGVVYKLHETCNKAKNTVRRVQMRL